MNRHIFFSSLGIAVPACHRKAYEHTLKEQECSVRLVAALIMETEEWLDREDKVKREARLERLRWLALLTPKVDWMLCGTGPISKCLLDEARYCFAYGQYLGSIVLGLSFLEISLAGAFHAAGRKDLERSTIAELSKEALSCGWLSQADYEAIEQVRKYRNPITHFRPPGHGERVEARAFHDGKATYEVIESDARKVMQTVFHLLLKVVPWAARELPIA